MRILAIIPARGGSKGVPRKNLTSLAGRPLIAYTISAALKAKSLDRVVVSTEDSEIATVSRDLGVEVIDRPSELAQDESATHDVLLNVTKVLTEENNYTPDAVMTLQPTSPLRKTHHIEEAAAQFINDPNCDSLVSCVHVPHIYHPSSLMRKNETGYLDLFQSGKQPTRRQQKEILFARNGAAIYITRMSCITKYIFGGNLIPYLMDNESSLDIDMYEDLVLAEKYMKNSNEESS